MYLCSSEFHNDAVSPHFYPSTFSVHSFIYYLPCVCSLVCQSLGTVGTETTLFAPTPRLQCTRSLSCAAWETSRPSPGSRLSRSPLLTPQSLETHSRQAERFRQWSDLHRLVLPCLFFAGRDSLIDVADFSFTYSSPSFFFASVSLRFALQNSLVAPVASNFFLTYYPPPHTHTASTSARWPSWS